MIELVRASGTSLLQAFLDGETDPAAWVGVDGQYQVVNAAHAAMLGLPPGEALGPRTDRLRCGLLGRLECGAELAAYLHRLDGGAVEPADLELAERGTPRRVWRFRSTPLFGTDGELLGWRETWSEVTEAEHLRRSRAEQSAAAGAARRKLDEQLAARDHFVARASHEMRTPLTAITGFCRMLEDSDAGLSPVQRQAVEKIAKNASILLQLVSNFLDMARLESGTVPVSRDLVDVGAVAREAVDSIEPQFREKKLAVEVELNGLPTIVSDRLKLRQILINLLGNAVKYTERGEVRLTGRHAGDAVELSVSDTGQGIAAEHLTRIFEPYVQVDGEQNGQVGTGLGLAICDKLADRLKARLAVTSRVGEGSTFTLRLPLEPPADHAPAPASGAY